MRNIATKINIRKDAWNWWHACNKVSYGVDWKKRIPLTMQKKIVGKKQADAYRFILPHLRKIYRKLNITEIKNEVNELFKQKQAAIFQRMEKVTERKLYRRTFTLFLTTFPRAPYNFKKGYIWLPIVWPQEGWLSVFAHELLHFQTYAYWEKSCLRHLTRTQFEDLKEALTIVLNEEFLDLIVWRDKGYECHKKIRMKLQKYWKENKNFDKLVRFGLEIMKNNSSR